MEQLKENSFEVCDYLSGSGPTVLIVDDNDVNLLILFRQVRRAFPNHNVIVACNGNDGIKKYVSHSPDIILTDISMPLINGHQMTKHIREIEFGFGKRIPIVAITCNIGSGEVKKCLGCGDRCIATDPDKGCGIDAFFSKPITAADLSIIMSYIDKIQK